MAGFDTKVMNDYGEYEIRFYTKDKREYVAVQEFCRNILTPKIMSEQVLKCDTCKHEKAPWFSRCADCSDYELWEAKDDKT